MATTSYKVLGQSNPSATTATTLYTVPSSTEAVISSLVICNQSGSPATYRIAVRPNGTTLAAVHYIVYDAVIAGNNTTAYTLGITVDAADVVTIYASTATLSFVAFGSEIV
jgi:Tfp pilus assembly protein PilW